MPDWGSQAAAAAAAQGVAAAAALARGCPHVRAALHGLGTHLDAHNDVRLPQLHTGRAGRLRNDAQLHRQGPKVVSFPPIIATVERDRSGDPLDLPRAYERAGHIAAACCRGLEGSDGLWLPIAPGCSKPCMVWPAVRLSLSCRAPWAALGGLLRCSGTQLSPCCVWPVPHRPQEAWGGGRRRGWPPCSSCGRRKPLQPTTR